MVAVRKIVLTNIESHLRAATENAENVRRLQDELETVLIDFEREKSRFNAGEIAKDVFEDLTDQHRAKVNVVNQRIAELCRESIAALRRAELEVKRNSSSRRAAAHRTARRSSRRTRTRKARKR
jgi:hypothetical protein